MAAGTLPIAGGSPVSFRDTLHLGGASAAGFNVAATTQLMLDNMTSTALSTSARTFFELFEWAMKSADS